MFPLRENNSFNLKTSVTMNWENIRTRQFAFENVSKIRTVLWNNLPAESRNAEF